MNIYLIECFIGGDRIMEFKDILGHAFDLAMQKVFTVHFVSNGNRENKQMTYMELGMFLVSNSGKIIRIDVHVRD